MKTVFKRVFSIAIFSFLVGSLASCGEKPIKDDDLVCTKQTYTFTNLSSFYDFQSATVDSYQVEGHAINYIDIKQFFNALKPLVNNNLSVTILPNLNKVRIRDEQYGLYANISWSKDAVFVPYNSFFNYVVSSTASTIDYSYAMKVADYSMSGSKSITFDLKSYDFDIYYYKGSVLMPFSIFNTLFFSQQMYNIYFNGDAFYGVSYYLGYSTSEEDYNSIKTSSLNNQEQSVLLRKETYNNFLFDMKYFYGLKEFKGYSDDFVSASDEALFLSTNVEDNNQGLINIMQKQLNELHSNICEYSVYQDPSVRPNILAEENMGEYWKTYYNARTEYRQRRADAFPSGVPEVRYQSKTAIVTFDSFVTGTNEERKREDAYKYDSFYFMRYALNKAIQHGNIDNVVIDISLNGGGNLGALIRVLGVLSDNYINYTTFNTLNREYTNVYYNVDADLDKSYQDKDAFSQFKYYILTSINTFSAANSMASMAKCSNIATLIGEKTGGGMCSVLPLILADGTTIRISSNNAIMAYTNNEYNEIESGVNPDISFARENFYDDVALANKVESNN